MEGREVKKKCWVRGPESIKLIAGNARDFCRVEEGHGLHLLVSGEVGTEGSLLSCEF